MNRGATPRLGGGGGEEFNDQAVPAMSVSKAFWGWRCCMPQHVLFKSFKPRCEGWALHELKTTAQRQLT